MPYEWTKHPRLEDPMQYLTVEVGQLRIALKALLSKMPDEVVREVGGALSTMAGVDPETRNGSLFLIAQAETLVAIMPTPKPQRP